MNEPEVPKKRKSLDDIIHDLTEISDDKDSGSDRFRALKMLAGMEGATVSLPQPMKEEDVIRDLVTLMGAAGKDLCRIAYSQSFRRAGAIDDVQLSVEDVPPEIMQKVKRVNTLKNFYKMFPELRRPGFPAGYPQGKGPLMQQAWLRRKAAEMLRDREQLKHDAMVRDDAAKEAAPDGGTPATP